MRVIKLGSILCNRSSFRYYKVVNITGNSIHLRTVIHNILCTQKLSATITNFDIIV